MTISKKISISVVFTIILAGFLAFTTPTHAGFFDWLFGKNVQQSATVVNSAQNITAETATKKGATHSRTVPCDPDDDVIVTNIPGSAGNAGSPTPDKDYWCKNGSGSWFTGAPEAEEDGQVKPAVISNTTSKVKASTRVPVATLRPGVANVNVTALQKRLAEAGYYSGSITGVYDTATMKAVTAFQRARRLTADGIAGVNTITNLNTLPAGLSPDVQVISNPGDDVPVLNSGDDILISNMDSCEVDPPNLIVSYENTSSNGPLVASDQNYQGLGRFVLHARCDLQIKHINLQNDHNDLFESFKVYKKYGQGGGSAMLLATTANNPNSLSTEVTFSNYLEMSAGDTLMLEVKGKMIQANESNFTGATNTLRLFIYHQHVYDANTNETLNLLPSAFWHLAPYFSERIIGWATPADKQLIQ